MILRLRRIAPKMLADPVVGKFLYSACVRIVTKGHTVVMTLLSH